MRGRPEIARTLGQAALVTTVVCLAILLIAGTAARQAFLRSRFLDGLLFAVWWSYVLLIPILSGLAVAMGRRSGHDGLRNYAVLVIWFGVVVGAGILTLG